MTATIKNTGIGDQIRVDEICRKCHCFPVTSASFFYNGDLLTIMPSMPCIASSEKDFDLGLSGMSIFP